MFHTDLHIHTVASTDADFPPQEIVGMARAGGLNTIAITDHNRVRSIAPAIEAGAACGLRVIPGIEIDCELDGLVLHILGYHINYHDPRYGELDDFYYKQEAKSSWESLDKLCRHLNIQLDPQTVQTRVREGTIVPEDAADLIITDPRFHGEPWLQPYLPGGSRSDNPNVNFFWDFFGQGKPAYTGISFLKAQEVLDLIHGTGGIAVIAHPSKITEHDPAILRHLLELDVQGMEVYSSYNSQEQTDEFYRMAKERGLLITCGSDFHGIHKPSITIGGIRYIHDEAEIYQGC